MLHPRLERVFNAHQPVLATLAPVWGADGPVALFNRLADADPSDDPAYGNGKKLYMDWLLRQAKAGQVHPDNLAEVTLALRVFVATPKAGDLNRFKTVEALTDATLGTPRRQLAAMMAQPDRLALWQCLDGFPEAPPARVDFALERLVAADPGGGRHLPHLLRWLSDGTAPLLPEDLPRVQSYLEIYLHNRQRLMPNNKRDLALCVTAGDLGGLIAPFRKDTTYSIDERLYFEETALARGDAVRVAETPHFRLLHITTEAGAKRLGKGTEWCTSWGDGDGQQNNFTRYIGDLLYLRSKHDGCLFQLHFRSWEISNAKDKPIADFLGLVQRHPGLFHTLAFFAVPVIPTALFITSEKGHADKVASLLTYCQSDPVHKRAADSVASGRIPAALIKAADNGLAAGIASLLTVCQFDPDYRHAANTVAAMVLPIVLTKAINNGSVVGVAALLTACQAEPDYRHAVNSVAATVLPAALSIADKQCRRDDFDELLTSCKFDRVWAEIAKTWEQRRTQARKSWRQSKGWSAASYAIS